MTTQKDIFAKAVEEANKDATVCPYLKEYVEPKEKLLWIEYAIDPQHSEVYCELNNHHGPPFHCVGEFFKCKTYREHQSK
jgi:hypothetical protein